MITLFAYYAQVQRLKSTVLHTSNIIIAGETYWFYFQLQFIKKPTI